jgi:subtilisin family serine protease
MNVLRSILESSRVGLLLTACLGIGGLDAQLLAGDDRDPLIPDQIVLQLAPDRSLDSVLATLAPFAPGLEAVEQVPGRPIHLLRFDVEGDEPSPELEQALQQLVVAGVLVWGEFGYEAQTGEGRTDSLWVTGLSLGPADYRGQFAGELLGLDAAHGMARGAGVVVAIVDSGLDATHPVIDAPISAAAIDLVDGGVAITDPADGVDNDGDGLVDEMAGHGTFVASLVHLVAPEATLLPIRILDTEGRTSVYLMVKGIAAAIDAGADIINMSVGTTYDSVAIEYLVDEAEAAGIVLIASIGNLDREEPKEHPAADGGAYGVVATDPLDHRAAFSNFGDFAALAAPGTIAFGGKGELDPISSVLGAVPGGGVGGWSGTSFSTAFVAGAAALVRGQHPEWPDAETPAGDLADEVMDRLRASAVPIDANNPGYEELLGAGRLDVAAAVALGPPVLDPADFDGDGVVGGADLAFLLSHWGSCAGCPADLDGDAFVGGSDLAGLLAAWTH